MAQKIDANSFINAIVNQFTYQYCLGKYKPAAGTGYVDAFVDTAKKSFIGRMNKIDYLLFIVPTLIITLVLAYIPPVIHPILGTLSTIVILFTALPSFACTARRLHDIDMTGWLSLIMIIPIINIVFAVYLCITDGKKEANQYGEAPADPAE